MKNPFKFGTLVDGNYFTDRKEEAVRLKQIIESENHLIMIAPRRYGKTSLVHKVTYESKRQVIWLDLQILTSVSDFASQLLKQLFKVYPFERIKFLIKNFRLIPTLSVNPSSESVEIAFQPNMDGFVLLEDVFNLINSLGESGNKPIVVLDEFQEIINLDKNLDKKLRAILQLHTNVNYVFLGSVESMMRDIFEKKKSPFYHFGSLFILNKIPVNDFKLFLIDGLEDVTDKQNEIAEEILHFTKAHPYYTQYLASNIWMYLDRNKYSEHMLSEVIQEIIALHDNDYERLWNNLNQTDKKVLISLALEGSGLLSNKANLGATSTTFSALKRLTQQGVIIKEKQHEFDDPFFKQWLINKRNN